MKVAALYVETGGAYYGLEDVDPWDRERDARRYAGPHPVVAHPPCERWGRYAEGGPSARVRRMVGDDAGCFAAALAAIRRWSGIIEHPADSKAWRAFGIPAPPHTGGWIRTLDGGWTCRVDQGWYGHPARKATWLLAYGVKPPPLIWDRYVDGRRLEDGFHSSAERAAARAAGVAPVPRISARERLATPEPFRDLLLDIARSSVRRAA